MKASPGAASKVPSKPGRVLAIDFGTRRLGLAVSDPLGFTAQPLSSLERVNRNEDFRRLRKICREHEVKEIVVGYPLRLKGEEGESARRVAAFARRLHRELGLPVELEDERLTTFQAREILAQTGALRKRQAPAVVRSAAADSPQVDSLAASLILRSYLDRKARVHPAGSPGKE